jgi:nucleoside-diphosphate kinase
VNYAQAASTGKGVSNIIHASATREEADKEIAHWFKPDELHSYEATHEKFTQPRKQ